ncbi:MAG: hypothetical protein JHD15_07130 [Phenylobacterium sp.]|uniref:hypothetical protein n=1 Tax=Phenylobacterium sp. TaxID=1871053 RepID=UPI001A292D5E|nr:hypothetical protein [Phenylobacterium sp.]MBJ7410126.1 hypothetical protein [Phenylobacterium sp.]
MAATTNSDIVRRALRLIGVVAAGQEPTGADQSDAMERLQSIVMDLPGLVLNGRWREKAVNAAYTAEEGRRITVTLPGDVTLPTTITPTGGCTRPPLDLARVWIQGAADNAGLWVFVASLGEWRQVDGLEIGGDFPFGGEDVDGVTAQLAVAMADEYGPQYPAQPRTLAKAAASVASFRARFKKAEPRDWRRPSDYPADCDFSDYA